MNEADEPARAGAAAAQMSSAQRCTGSGATRG